MINPQSAKRIKENIRWWNGLRIHNYTVLCNGEPPMDVIQRYNAEAKQQFKDWLYMAREYGA